VPFGEYIPFRRFINFSSLVGDGIGYSAGEKIHKVTLPATLDHKSFMPTICYEIIFPSLLKRATQQAGKVDWILNVSNDGWFGNSIGPYQHFYMARIRAVENKLPLVRVANSGISGMIDPYGRIIVQSKLLQREVIITNLVE